MNILLVAATESELIPFVRRISNANEIAIPVHSLNYQSHELNFLITGVGGIATAVLLSAHLVDHKYDLIINAGIAGSFKNNYKIGDTVFVSEEIFADLGVEEADGTFLDLFEIGLADRNGRPFNDGKILASGHLNLTHLPRVKAISVNKVHGMEKSITDIVNKYDPDIETMEGAAFLLVCHHHHQASLQLRTISNFVEPRDREKWNIPLAIENLARSLDYVLEVLA